MGADVAEQAQADVVLVDPQYSRFLRANVDTSPYETVLEQMTGTPAVTLFHRYDLTQEWVNSGQLDLERVRRDLRDKTVTLLERLPGPGARPVCADRGGRALIAGLIAALGLMGLGLAIAANLPLSSD